MICTEMSTQLATKQLFDFARLIFGAAFTFLTIFGLGWYLNKFVFPSSTSKEKLLNAMLGLKLLSPIIHPVHRVCEIGFYIAIYF